MEGGRKEKLLKLAATVPKPMIKIRKVCVVGNNNAFDTEKATTMSFEVGTATHATQIKTHAGTYGEMLVLS